LDDLSVIADNSAMAKNIAMVAKNLKIKTIIHLSSASVYPNLDGDYDETSIVNPSMNSDALYGLSKLNEEVLLDHFCDKQMNVIHLRSAMIYGLGMDTTRIIPVLEREINEKGTATLFANGTRLINMVDVNVLVDLIIYLIKHPEKGVVNVADECIPLIDLAKRIIETSNYKSAKIILNPSGNSYQFRLVAKKYLALKVKMKHV
jgi:nucleoside-diphosphate-sugar epimerase